ncbi:MAG: hypothetical protein PW788_00175 [Micavibrio sp.]|nr:hypothetical protein [Micavibrio sp.]
MILRQEFQDTIDASRLKQPGFDIMRNGGKKLEYKELHQFIAGPARSGKTTLAADYCRELAAAKFVLTAEPVYLNPGDLENLPDIAGHLNNLRGRGVIIDEPERLTQSTANRLRNALVDRFEDMPCVVIFTGDKVALEKFIAEDTGFGRRYQKGFVETGATLTSDEIRDFNNVRTAERLARAQTQNERQLQAARNASSAAWQQMKTVDVSLPATIKPLKPAKFRKPETPRV